MNFQTTKRIFCCLLAVLILCFAVVRPVVTSATGFVPAAVAGFCGLSVETAASLILSFLAVGHVVEYWDDLTFLVQSAVNRFADLIGGSDALPVYTYNNQIYVNVSAVNDVAYVVENSFLNAYGSAWELGQQYDFMYSINFGNSAYELVIWTNSNVYSEINSSTTDLVYCTGPFVAYMNPRPNNVVTSDEWDFAFGPFPFSFNGREVIDIYKTSVASIAATGNTYSNTIVVTNPYTDEQETLVPIAPVIDDVVDTGITVPVEDVISGTNTPSVDGTDILSLILSWIKAIWQAIVDGAAQIEAGIVSAIRTLRSVVEVVSTTLSSILSEIRTGIATAIEAVAEEIVSLGWLLVDIVDAIFAVPGLIADTISDVLTDIFVPSSDYLSIKVKALRSRFDWISPIIDFAESLSFDSSEPPVIYIHLDDAEGSYDLGGTIPFLDMRWYSRYKATGDLIISGFLWALFGWRMYIKLPGIINGVAGTIGRIG